MPFALIGVIEEIGRRGEEEVSVEWRIPNFPSLLHGRDYWYWSPIFGIGGGSWYLRMWPNWERVARNPASGWVCLKLHRCDEGPAETLRFSAGIRGSGGVEKSREGEKEFRGCNDCYRWNDFCSRSHLLEHRTRLMPGDTLTITCVLKRPGAARAGVLSHPHSSNQVAPKNGSQFSDKQDACTQTDCNVEVEVQESTVKRDACAQTDCNLEAEVLPGVEQSTVKRGAGEVLKSLQSLLAGGEDSDCLIKVRGKEFRAHRNILRARSPVFRAMFAHDTAERQSGTVTMEDCDPETIPDFLEHVYTGSVEMISDGNVFSLYATSEKYDFPTLKRACAEFLKNNLTVASFCETILLAIKYDEKELVERATEFFCSNALDIVQTPEWQIFLPENSTIGNELYIKQLRK